VHDHINSIWFQQNQFYEEGLKLHAVNEFFDRTESCPQGLQNKYDSSAIFGKSMLVGKQNWEKLKAVLEILHLATMNHGCNLIATYLIIQPDFFKICSDNKMFLVRVENVSQNQFSFRCFESAMANIQYLWFEQAYTWLLANSTLLGRLH
jgi:hypothetical protein